MSHIGQFKLEISTMTWPYFRMKRNPVIVWHSLECTCIPIINATPYHEVRRGASPEFPRAVLPARCCLTVPYPWQSPLAFLPGLIGLSREIARFLSIEPKVASIIQVSIALIRTPAEAVYVES
jgi:hypothetical protein